MTEIIEKNSALTLLPSTEITATTCWQKLEAMMLDVGKTSMDEMFATQPDRIERFSLSVGDIFADFSKNQITPEIFNQLIELAKDRSVPEAIELLFSGAKLNTSEGRSVLHVALRQDEQFNATINDEPVMPEVLKARKQVLEFANKLNQGNWKGVTGKPIEDVVNIGIGGSDLGPVITVEALEPFKTSDLNIHFISNIDPYPLEKLFHTLNPETTLFIISSKSFGTLETLENAKAAIAWLRNQLKTDEVGAHTIAVTTKKQRAIELGVNEENILDFWDWVGGRYSIWSAIGLPLAISIGPENYLAFLAGAKEMDEHFATAPLAKNLPAILALIGIWNGNFLGANSHAILPYDFRLRHLPDYIQQMDMESNGKNVQRNGKFTSYETGPIIWGQAGTNGQHAFYQLLHQGTHFIPVDFIVAANAPTNLPRHHEHLIANCFAQAQALMEGANSDITNDVMLGNSPSNLLLLKALTPKTLGALLAMYEHKVFVQGIIWNLNSFDQPGVELGKKLAKGIASSLTGDSQAELHTATQFLMNKLADLRKE